MKTLDTELYLEDHIVCSVMKVGFKSQNYEETKARLFHWIVEAKWKNV
jgi:hypothetical protein